MKVVQINATCGSGSTGKICVAVSDLLTENGIENYILYTQGSSTHPAGIKYAGHAYKKVQALKSRVLGNYGFNSHYATRKLIKHLERIQPDIVHIHNIHGHDCDLELLFRYFKRNHTKLFWTFHDCWAFTGYCTHFDAIGCQKWTENCFACPQAKQFSWFFDRSQTLYHKKKELFSDLDLTIITPSQWLADLVKQSFLKEYPVQVIHNGIDLNVFRPRPSNFRKKYHCEHKIILLGVSFDWGVRKGLDVFVELANRLDERFQIVLVGTNETTDRALPENIISIHRTQNQIELAEIYTAANLFVNPTKEEVLGLVNMEALACGTPVITFNTGGSPESLDETCGLVVPKNDVDGLIRAIYTMVADNACHEMNCLNRASAFSQEMRFEEYIKLYHYMERNDSGCSFGLV